MSGNKSLSVAAKVKNDEFYTLIEDIENELKHYRQHFADKVVFCNCDDPYESNFFKFFVMNFNRLKLKRLICTCYSGSPIMGEQMTISNLLKRTDIQSDTPYRAIINKVYDKTGDGAIDMDDINELFVSGENELSELKGDGDFRSEECISLLKESDIIVTNPPFSLFREYVAQLIEYQKSFVIIGNQNAIHYKEIFPLLKDNKIWLGYNSVKKFMKPDKSFKTFGNIMWFTNLDIKKRHEELILIKKYDEDYYPKYLNFDGIDVGKVADIPYDYDGYMGVPDSFLQKYNPCQFEIIGLAESSLGKKMGFSSNLTEEECEALFHENKSFRRGNPIFRGKDGKLHKPFSRIIIRRRTT